MSTRTRNRTQYPEAHERTAARKYLEHSHAATTLHGKPRREANRNAQAIDEEHPRARDIALAGTARELGQLPPHLRRHQLDERQRAGLDADDVDAIRKAFRARPYQEDDQEQEEERRNRAREAAQRGGELATSGVGAVAHTGWGGDILDFFVWGAALSIGYLLITKVAATAKLAEGATNIVRAVVSPSIDPLSPKGVP